MLFAEYSKNWEMILKKECTLEEIKQIIRQRSGRELRIQSNPMFRVDDALFTLGYQEHVGFFIQANQLIPEGTLLFNYGGEYCPNREELKYSSPEDQEYLLKIEVKDKIIGMLQARTYGDFGSILSHLPNAQQGLIRPEQCQTENCAYTVLKNDVVFRATQPILPGEVIGYDYSLYYWDNCGLNPVYFVKNSLKPRRLSQVSQTPLISFFDAATGMYLQSSGENAYLMLTPSALYLKLASEFIQELMRQAQDHSYPAVFADFEYENVRTRVNITELFQLVQRGPSLPPLTFFGAHTNQQGCMPPPHSIIENNRTKIQSAGNAPHDDPRAYRLGL